jgi:hypothetical protein
MMWLRSSSYAICAQSSWPSFVLFCEECSFPPLLCVILLHSLRGGLNLSSPSFSSTTFQNFPGTSGLVAGKESLLLVDCCSIVLFLL